MYVICVNALNEWFHTPHVHHVILINPFHINTIYSVSESSENYMLKNMFWVMMTRIIQNVALVWLKNFNPRSLLRLVWFVK